MNLDDYFNSLKEKLKPEDLDGIDTKINFDLKGRNVFLTVKDNQVNVEEGEAQDAEVTIKAKEDDLISVIKGDSNPMMAMMMGKLKISNPAAMMKYAKLLGLM